MKAALYKDIKKVETGEIRKLGSLCWKLIQKE
jgi:hypothetical protein